jgi:hypothetical protein
LIRVFQHWLRRTSPVFAALQSLSTRCVTELLLFVVIFIASLFCLGLLAFVGWLSKALADPAGHWNCPVWCYGGLVLLLAATVVINAAALKTSGGGLSPAVPLRSTRSTKSNR